MQRLDHPVAAKFFKRVDGLENHVAVWIVDAGKEGLNGLYIVDPFQQLAGEHAHLCVFVRKARDKWFDDTWLAVAHEPGPPHRLHDASPTVAF